MAGQVQEAAAEPFAQRLWDSTVRIDNMWPIPGCSPSSEMIDALEYRELLPEPLQGIIDRWDEDEREQLIGGDRDLWEELFASMYRANLSGFLVQCSAPVYRKINDTTSEFSWGWTHCDFVFGTTADEAIDAAIAIAETWYDTDMAKAEASK